MAKRRNWCRMAGECGVAWHAVVAADALGDDEVVGARIAGKDIAVARSAGAYYAFSNICTHQFALLSDGTIEDGCIECPLHQGRFDLATGKPLSPPVEKPIAVHKVRVEAGQVMVELQDAPR